MKKLARDLGLDIGQIVSKGDKQGVFKLLKHPMSTPNSKHRDVVHHFAKERSLGVRSDLSTVAQLIWLQTS